MLAVPDLDAHAAVGAGVDQDMELGVHGDDLVGRPPLQIHGDGLVDVVDFAVEGRHAPGGDIQQAAQYRDIFCFQVVAAGTKFFCHLAVAHKEGLLGLMYDQVGAGIEVLAGVLPHQDVVSALIVDDIQKFQAHICLSILS